jgi:phosphatidate cytidylyltransferase
VSNDPASSPQTASSAQGSSELTQRVLSGIVMAAVSIGAAIYGSWPFALLWTGASLAVAFEWQRLVHKEAYRFPFSLAAMAVLLAGVGAWLSMPLLLLAAVAVAGLMGVVTSAGLRRETLAGVGYAAGLAASVILCRNVGYDGFVVILWLFAAVWGTDIMAYFTGRSLGGPKLWPSVSPKKTWSGALGGLAGGILISCVLLGMLGVSLKPQHILLSAAFSVLTQVGDLFESALKRRYGVKDSGSLIPGHGGFMDRLDGFIVAVIAAAAFGAWRGGFTGVPAGLLQW